MGRNGVTFTLTGVDNTGAVITPISVISGDDPSTPEVEVGEFWFTDLTPGTYTVTETVPTGFIATTPIVVSNIVLTSGVEFVSRVGQANLPAGSTKQEILLDNLAPIGVPDLAFGNLELGSIHGNKFTDVNGNGVQDAGDLGTRWRDLHTDRDRQYWSYHHADFGDQRRRSKHARSRSR